MKGKIMNYLESNKYRCIHNRRTRYLNGFFCDDCQKFFHEDTDEYKLDEGMSRLHMVLHNYYCDCHRKKIQIDDYLINIKEKVYYPEKPNIELYNEALNYIKSIGLNEHSASIVLK